MSNPDLQVDGADIAIVGMACRFPGAGNLTEYWNNLVGGVESIRFFTEAELLEAGVSEQALQDPTYVMASPFLGEYDKFDAAYFGFNPHDASVMDPQHRLALECSVAALEDACCVPETFDGRIGMFAGSAMNTYFMNAGLSAQFAEEYLPTLIGSDKDFLATRVSYKLDLTGPSISVQTACSTSLVAVHLASQSLLNEECDAALAGGVSVRVPQEVGYRYQEEGVYSPDGHCRPFDSKAGGTIFGSGVGMVVLKRLTDAVDNGDHVYAVIKGSAINNDGSAKADYTAPSVTSQSEVIAEALAVADVDPATVTYVEAHGTGTYLGDPIEVEALTQAYRASTDRVGFCTLGSVKSNFGHLDAAAGVAGIIKVALSLEHEKIPATLHFTEPNPLVDLDKSPFRVSSELQTWTSDGPRRAGITSLGIGGTNAHVVLEQAPKRESSGGSREFSLLVLSAKTHEALDAATQDLAGALDGETAIADVAYSYQVGRPRREHRRMLVCTDAADAREVLLAHDSERALSAYERDRTRPVALMFPGQGCQYPNMGRDLYRAEPRFREAVDACAEILRDRHDLDLLEHVYPPAGQEDRAARDLVKPSLAHPAIFTMSYAMAQLWLSWGVEPDALVGHSFGEYAACCTAGALSLEDALALATLRGRLMEGVAPGAMLSIQLPPEEVEPYLGSELTIAAINAPELCVASGPIRAIDELEARLEALDIGVRRPRIGFAAHSKLLDPILEEFGEFARAVDLEAPGIPLISSVTGSWMTDNEISDPTYWVRHIRQTAQFSDGMDLVLAEPDRILIDVGPSTILATIGKMQRSARPTHTFLDSMRHPAEHSNDEAHLLDSLGHLWMAGGKFDWSAVHGAEKRSLTSLPTYPFERRRYWLKWSAAEMQPVSHEGTYVYTWRRLAPSAPEGVSPREMLLVAGADGTAGSVAEALTADGHSVRVVSGGEELSSVAKVPEHVVCFSPDFHASLEIARWIGERATEPTSLTVVTRSLFDVTGDEAPAPEESLGATVAQVAANEYPHIDARIIDVDGEHPVRLAAELTGVARVPEVAHRGRHRWERVLEPVEPSEGASRLEAGGTYLVTGGFGGIGRLIARALAREVGARLVLVTRTPYPSAEQDERRAFVKELESAGADVLVCNADVADTGQMAAALEQARARFGRINGVVHAAGAVSDNLIALKERGEAESVLAPKVEGTRLLRSLLPDADFIALFSSLMGTLRAPGTVDYAAANAYLDATAASSTGDPFVLSISWPGWQGTGLLAKSTVRDDVAELTITPERGVELFLKLLRGNMRHVLVSATDPRSLDLATDDGASEEDEAHRRPETWAEYEAPESELEKAIDALWRELLLLDKISVHDSFVDLGGHSLLAVKMVSRLRKALGVELTIKDVFESPTVAALAAHIEELILAGTDQ